MKTPQTTCKTRLAMLAVRLDWLDVCYPRYYFHLSFRIHQGLEKYQYNQFVPPELNNCATSMSSEPAKLFLAKCLIHYLHFKNKGKWPDMNEAWALYKPGLKMPHYWIQWWNGK